MSFFGRLADHVASIKEISDDVIDIDCAEDERVLGTIEDPQVKALWMVSERLLKRVEGCRAILLRQVVEKGGDSLSSAQRREYVTLVYQHLVVSQMFVASLCELMPIIIEMPNVALRRGWQVVELPEGKLPSFDITIKFAPLF